MSPEEVLEQWHTGIRICHIAHNIAATRYSRLNRIYGIPVVILSTVVGTTVFATVSESVDPRVQVMVGLLSVTAAVLASLQTFLRFAELAEKHRAAGARYGRLRREIEHAQAFPEPDPKALSALMKSFKDRWDALDQEVPAVQQRIHDRAVRIVHSGRESLSEPGE